LGDGAICLVYLLIACHVLLANTASTELIVQIAMSGNTVTHWAPPAPQYVRIAELVGGVNLLLSHMLMTVVFVNRVAIAMQEGSLSAKTVTQDDTTTCLAVEMSVTVLSAAQVSTLKARAQIQR